MTDKEEIKEETQEETPQKEKPPKERRDWGKIIGPILIVLVPAIIGGIITGLFDLCANEKLAICKSSTATPPHTENVIIKFIFYNGSVPLVESDEYVEIKNIGDYPIDLDGWRINAGDHDQDFFFPAYILEPGVTIRVYTNEEHPESGGFSFQSDNALWKNGGDCGFLYDSIDSLVDEKCY